MSRRLTFSQIAPWLLLLLILLLGLGLRLLDLKNPPFDFHPTRQLGSAVIARGMYYRALESAPEATRRLAVDLWRDAPVYEAPILETLVARTYLVMGGENLWVARLYSSLLWLSGAIPLILIGRRLGWRSGAIASVAFYLIVPFGVRASRSFQPDPGMAACLLFAAWALLEWFRKPNWARAVAAGALAGLAVLIKPVAAFPVGGALAGLAIGGFGIRRAIREPQLWAMAALAVLPSLAYLAFIPGRSTGFLEFWVGSFTGLWTQFDFYVRWVQEANSVVALAALCLGLIGTLLFPAGATRGLVLGLWLGYGAYGLVFPYQISTHDYYHLMLIPIAALSLMPLAELVWGRLRQERGIWRAAALAVLAFLLAVRGWQSRSDLLSEDYRGEAGGWKAIGEALPKDGPILALTHDYGFPLAYYGWTHVTLWPTLADVGVLEMTGHNQGDFEAAFRDRAKGYRYFLVTDFGELARQPELKDYLEASFPAAAQGDGFVVYDLALPIPDG
jgi:hypothetical protein